MIRGEALQAPWSLGCAPPKTPAPVGATDCHHHIFDPRFERPEVGRGGKATVEDYRLFKRRLGLSRSVIVAASYHGTDNRGVVAALEHLGTDVARAVVLVDPEVPQTALEDYRRAGVRGMRVYMAKNRVPDREELAAMGRRAADLGWSLQFVGNREREVLVERQDEILGLPCPVVVDHFGWAPQPEGTQSATAKLLYRLLERPGGYVKLSGLYLSSREGFPAYRDIDPLAVKLVGLNPDQLIWGSDWPHPVAGAQKPDGAMLFDRLAEWAPDEAVRRRILVDNPTRLYWAD
ncbi:amidohydrolase family protein [Caulobacter sp. KR2-114]